jgi:transposase
MFVRTVSHRRGDKRYSYVQLVESYRRPGDKVPAQRVIANLGDLPPATVENLKLALKASRDGGSLLLATEAADLVSAHSVTANLEYLDIAVMRAMWQQWGLSSLLAELSGDEQSLVSSAQIVEILTLQRAVGAPGSKSYAERWFPRTALPELMGLPPERFNNTRVHRALQTLHDVGEQLAQRLPTLYQSQQGAFGCCFMDVTRTHFEGRRYDTAELSKTSSESDIRKRIGIVLLSNNEGYPLRWKTIGGRTMDVTGMGEMAKGLKDVEWLQGVPIVFDRAMGSEKTVRGLLATNIRFLTAARSNDIDSYLAPLSAKFHPCFLAASLVGLSPIQNVAWWTSGFMKEPSELSKTWWQTRPMLPVDDVSLVTIGCTDESYEDDICRVRAAVSSAGLVEVDPNLFTKDLGIVRLPNRQSSGEPQGEPSYLRLVAYFNPQLLVDHRRRAQRQMESFHQFVATLNEQLLSAKKSRTEEPTLAKVRKRLEMRNWLGLFDIQLTPLEVSNEKGRPVQTFRCEATLNQDAWSRRQRYHGFVLLLANSSLAHTGSELASTYRAKDIIEKDFQTIKGVVRLRPVFHYTDPKVQAHVTLCMLALLLQRTLEARLRKAGLRLSAPAALEALSECHLNRMSTGSMYSVTAPTAVQREILKALNLSHLVKPSSVERTITARPAS